MTSNSNVKGLILATAKPIPGGSPSAAVVHGMKANATNTHAILKGTGASGGGKRRFHGGTGKIVVPQHQMIYKVTNGSGQTPNNTSVQIAKNSTQGAENAKYDHYATQQGGKKVGGYNNKVHWGCYSGGKKSRKSRKSKKSKRSKKTRKSRK